MLEIDVCGGHFVVLIKEAKLVPRHYFIGRNIVCKCGKASYYSLWSRRVTMEKKYMSMTAILFFLNQTQTVPGHVFKDRHIVCKFGEDISRNSQDVRFMYAGKLKEVVLAAILIFKIILNVFSGKLF